MAGRNVGREVRIRQPRPRIGSHRILMMSDERDWPNVELPIIESLQRIGRRE